MEALRNLGIDPIGFIIYLVNFGVLVVVLWRLLYRPIIKFMDERQETIRRNISEAEDLRRRFQEETDKRAKESKAQVQKMEQELAESKRYAEKRAQELLAEASVQRDKMIEDTRQQIDEMKSRLQKDVENDVLSRIEKTILTILGNKVPQDVIRESVTETWKEVAGKDK